MLEQSLLINLSTPEVAETATSQFRKEFQNYENLFLVQPMDVQQYLREQAATVAEMIMVGLSRLHFSLPNRIVPPGHGIESGSIPVPARYREHVLGGILSRLVHSDIRVALHSRLLELENSSNLAQATSVILLRHALVVHLVHDILPMGKSVQYVAEKGDEIPSIPSKSENQLSVSSDSRANFERPISETGQGFYMPQWVAFDDQHHLLVNDLAEAKEKVTAMQRYIFVLQTAVGLAPYLVADEDYQGKRYGIVGQLINQGRALASYQVQQIIQVIEHRVSSHELDRGFSLSLPYFNDRTLTLESYHFDVIPKGRVMFVPAFVVLAVRAQGAKVAQNTHLNKSTRRHLLIELSKLEETFLR